MDYQNIPVNKYQTPLTEEVLSKYPDEVVQNLYDYITTVPFIKNLISPDRPKAKDLPRDNTGRIKIDLQNPHILEDMDYFRPTALYYEKHKCFTKLIPSLSPLSAYYKWFMQERERCLEGMVRETDGEWVTGDMYFYLNYGHIILKESYIDKRGRKRIKTQTTFPKCWEGVY